MTCLLLHFSPVEPNISLAGQLLSAGSCCHISNKQRLDVVTAVFLRVTCNCLLPKRKVTRPVLMKPRVRRYVTGGGTTNLKKGGEPDALRLSHCFLHAVHGSAIRLSPPVQYLGMPGCVDFLTQVCAAGGLNVLHDGS